MTTKHRPSLTQLADQAVSEAFRQSFDRFMHRVGEHHPRSLSYSRQFLRAWRAQLEWAEAREP